MNALKKIFALVTAAAVFTLSGCKNDDDNGEEPDTPAATLTVDAELLAGYAGKTYEVAVASNSAWTVAVDAAAATWCSVTPASGTGNGIVEVTTLTNPSGTNESRAATITFTAGSLAKTTAVKQAAVTTTLCTKCAWNGSEWVDAYVTTYNYPFEGIDTNEALPWDGIAEWGTWTFNENATSDKDGRGNTAAITFSATTPNAVRACKNLGQGWYLPAYEEMLNLASPLDESAIWNGGTLNGLSPAGLLKFVQNPNMDDGVDFWYHSSTENKGAQGRYTPDAGLGESCRVYLNYKGQYLAPGYKTDAMLLRCLWRP
jgi:hypothetical protein